MSISELNPEASEEKVLKLKDLNEGDCFRSVHESFDDAIRSDPPAFFRVTSSPEAQSKGKVAIIHADCKGGVMIRDGDHHVIAHKAETLIARNIPKLNKKKK